MNVLTFVMGITVPNTENLIYNEIICVNHLVKCLTRKENSASDHHSYYVESISGKIIDFFHKYS